MQTAFFLHSPVPILLSNTFLSTVYYPWFGKSGHRAGVRSTAPTPSGSQGSGWLLATGRAG